MMDEQEKNSHDGHRERMRQRLNSRGADGMEALDVLELMLFCSIPRANTRAIAETLLKRFGSFSGVLGAPVKDLIQVKGLGGKTAEFLHMMPQFSRFYAEDVSASSRRIFDVDSACAQMRSRFIGRAKECVSALIINARGQIVFHDVLTEGSVSQVPVYVRDLVALCIQYSGDVVFVAHNHPSGNLAPSRGDVIATKELQMALSGVYVDLVDHIIFTDGGFTSMRKSGWLSNISATVEAVRQEMLAEAAEAEQNLGLYEEVVCADKKI